MRPSNFLLSATAILASQIVAGQAVAAAIPLTEVNGDSCVPTYIYNVRLSAKQIRSKHYPANSIAVIHDNCSDGSELVVGVGGVAHHLVRKTTSGQPQALYEGGAFFGEGLEVEIRGGSLTLCLDDTSVTCGGEWRRVHVKVSRGRDSSDFDGTMASSC